MHACWIRNIYAAKINYYFLSPLIALPLGSDVLFSIVYLLFLTVFILVAGDAFSFVGVH